MRIVGFLLFVLLAATTFGVSYVGTRLSMMQAEAKATPSPAPPTPLPAPVVSRPLRARSAAPLATATPVAAPDPVAYATPGTFVARGGGVRAALDLALVRAHETTMANISAVSGGTIRFDDGSYLTVAAGTLPRDTGVTVALTLAAPAELRGFEPVGQAMIVKFRAPMDGVAFADSPSQGESGGQAGVALGARVRARLGGHAVALVKRVYMDDGTSTDFEETPSSVGSIVAADLAADHVLVFSEHYRATLLISLQRST